MSIHKHWQKALRTTEILRPRVTPLHTFEATRLPYVFLAESSVNRGDTVVRRGEVIVEKPSIVMPMPFAVFEGFEFEEEMGVDEELLQNFLLVRGVKFPSAKLNNRTDGLEVFEGRLPQAIDHHLTRLERSEDVHTGLLRGKEDVWPFAVLLFVCEQIGRSAESDFKKLFEDFERRGRSS